MRTSLSAILVLVLLGAAAPGAEEADRPVEGIAQAKRDLRLSFTVPGRVSEVLVEPGEVVREGQPLIRLDDEESRVRLELLSIRAESELELMAADAEWKLAINDEKRVREAFDRDAAAEFEVERSELETKRKKLALELFKQRRQEAKQQLRQAEVQHARYLLRSPIDGVVDDVYIDVGESVDALRPIIQVVNTDRLVIDAPAPTGQTLNLRVGGDAWVRFRLPGIEDDLVRGRIVHLARVADAASDTRIVRIETPNPADLPAGCAVFVWFSPPDDVAPERPVAGDSGALPPILDGRHTFALQQSR